MDLSNEQKEVLYGCLLGDGNLNIHKRAKNATFSYTCIDKETVEKVASYFTKDFFGKVSFCQYFDKRTNKVYSRYTYRTLSSPVLTEEYYNWYPDKKKIIPKINFTPVICYWWYIGDGCLYKRRIFLATDCFPKSNLEEIVLPKLNDFSPRLIKNGKETHFRTCFSVERSQKFLEYIGECTLPHFSYKWDFVPFVNNKYNFSEKEQKNIIYLANQNLSPFQISKIIQKYNVDTIRYFLKQKGLYSPKGNKGAHLKTLIKEKINSRLSVELILKDLNITLEQYQYFQDFEKLRNKYGI